MAVLVELRDTGLDVKRIAERSLCGVHYQTLVRYFRIYDRYGIAAFIPRRIARHKKEQAA
jgi:hypothetical protein